MKLTDLFERYAKQPGIRAETVRQFRAIIAHLVGYLGHDDASRVKAADIVGWRNALGEELSVKGKPRSPKTINGSYLSAANVTLPTGSISFPSPQIP
ncbi:hypothetical protein [Sphingomonas sp.]|uniref:hypothetical protein n=1 Tax=Sphingomonas sp. TaxID=28214 RepID=UPI0025E24C55|nr:hypothetical protein [Sphingomonas sp.]